MEKMHEHILGLLHEIDEICRKYEITYYAAGGTTIGAARHHGFIPWDDDADLYMTRENFYRFREAFRKEQPKDRVLECLDDNPHYPGTIPRYIEETTTTLGRFHCLNTCSGGLIIDIFILDPIPDDPQKQEEHLAKFNIYSDLVVPYYVYSHRNNNGYYHYYEYYKKKIKHQGRESVLRELEEELFQYKEEDCSSYVLRWATLPSIFPKEMMGEPVYLPFEDMEIPVPSKWWDYLYQLYGADWMYVPNHEEATQHVFVVNMEQPYTVYTSQIDRFIDKEEALKDYLLRKDLKVEEEKLRRPWYEILLQVNSDYVMYVQKKIIREHGYNLAEMMKSGKYRDIVHAFEFYLENQCTPQFLGSMRHSLWYRYKNPVFIQLEDSLLSYLLYALIAVGHEKKAQNILKARKFTGINLMEELKNIEQLLYQMKNICNAYYSGRLDEAQKALERVADKDMHVLTLRRVSLLMAVEKAVLPTEFEAVEEMIHAALKNDPQDGEFLKAYGDLLYKQGKIQEAKAIYEKAVPLTNNGMLILDIKEKIGFFGQASSDNSPDGLEKTSHLSPFEQVQFELLKEIDQICNENSIEYVLYGKTATQAYRYHTFERDYKNNTIVMTADNALKFMEAVKKENRQDRYLSSMLTNANHVLYDLCYADQNTLYFPLNDYDHSQNMGIYIRIKILRKKGSNRMKNYIMRGLESLHESYLVRIPATASKKERLIGKIGKGIMKISGESGRKRLAGYLFKYISDQALHPKRKEYFVTNGNIGLKHKNEVYPVKNFNKKESALLYDYQFPIPAFIAKRKYSYDEGAGGADAGRRGVFRFMDTHLTYSEFLNNIDLSPLYGPERENFEKSRSYTDRVRLLNRQIGRYWAIVCRIDDTMKMKEEYGPLKAKIKLLYQQKKYDTILDMLWDYDELVSYYQSFKLGFYFDKEILDIYCNCLKINERQEKADRLLEYIGQEKDY